MAFLSILSFPHPLLRQRAKEVSSIDNSIKKLIDDMLETMRSVSGVGLAAPQVGVPLRVIVIEVPEHQPIALINPEIVKRKGNRIVEEGCLSLPGYRGEVKRSVVVVVEGLNKEGIKVRIKGEGLLAQALEHELDHLNGILFIDRLVSPDKLYKVEEGKG